MKFSAILLAAGLSLRMQGRHKLLLPIGDESIVRRSARILLDAAPEELIVATGHNSADVVAALEGLALKTVFNPRYEEGQMTSVSTGLHALSKPCDAIMVCLADQVLLRATDYLELLVAFTTKPHGTLLVPQFEGRRGNPIIFSSEHSPDILKNGRHSGCRKLIADNPQAVFAYQATHDRYTIDIDTPSDYERILQRVASYGSAAP